MEELLRDIITYYIDRDEEQYYAFYIDRYTEVKFIRYTGNDRKLDGFEKYGTF